MTSLLSQRSRRNIRLAKVFIRLGHGARALEALGKLPVDAHESPPIAVLRVQAMLAAGMEMVAEQLARDLADEGCAEPLRVGPAVHLALNYMASHYTRTNRPDEAHRYAYLAKALNGIPCQEAIAGPLDRALWRVVTEDCGSGSS